MAHLQRLDDLRVHGRARWAPGERAWMAEPGEILEALTGEGFEEYRHEVMRSRRDRPPTGGVWQGLNSRTGAVASAIWVQRADAPPLVFVDIDGEPVQSKPVQSNGE